MKRINISMDDIVAERVDTFCEKHNIARSKLISLAVSEYISAQEQLPIVTKDLKEQLTNLESLLMSRLGDMSIEKK